MENKRFDPRNADKLMSKERSERLQPEKLIQHLELTNNDTIADLGAGPGMFTIPLAKRTDDKVYAMDVEPAMVDKLKANAAEEAVQNIAYLTGDLENVPLGNQLVTRVLNTFVIHEVESIENAIQEMKRILTPGGILLLVDWKKVETESGPPLHIRIPADDINDALQQNGFSTDVIHPSNEIYAIKALKPENS